jgi:hypothetical protein
MAQRSIVGASKSGSISRREAREAVRTAVSGRSIDHEGAREQSRGERDVSMSDRIRERYLGHFGSDAGRSVAKTSSRSASAGKKAGARKSARKSSGKKVSLVKAAKKSSTKRAGRKAS